MGAKLSDYVKKNYPDSKSDLFACFIEYGNQMAVKHGYNCMVTMQSWMFLSSFEKMREKVLRIKSITNLMHMENMVMGIAFGTAVTIFRNDYVTGYKGTYNQIKLQDIENDKPRVFPVLENRFAQTSTDNFSKIPGSPVAYWVSEAMLSIFAECDRMGAFAEGRKGLVTGNDDLYLKLWHEVCMDNFSVFGGYDNTKWKPCNKGGNYRKWYGNNDYIVNWGTEGKELANHRWPDGRQRSSLRNSSYFFKEGLTWTYITSGTKCFRYYPEGFAFAGTGPGLFPKNNVNLWYILAYTNSIVFDRLLKLIGSSTISLESGEVERAPIRIESQKLPEINKLAKSNTTLAKTDWDSFETSWDFVTHPFITYRSGAGYADIPMNKWQYRIADAYHTWESNATAQFDLLKKNEEELNRIFIDIYGLQDELTPEVEDKDVTVRKADLGRDIRSFISYAVGCMFGRYSLDVDGLAYAGGEWDNSKYASFAADKDNIIPISDDEYFEDDIVGRFVKFVEVVYGKDTLDENLKFIADALGGKGQPKDVIRNYFLNDFYSDHCKIYQKRPIYWLFDSGKKNGFKCLIYMHRYQPDTIARIRTDYVHEQQARYRTAIADLETRIANASTGERVKLNKQLKTLNDQAVEIHEYEEKIHHLADQMISIDLDDGVKVNYAKFQDVLAKIK